MTVHKVTVSLDESAYAAAARSAEQLGMSLSAWLSETAERGARIQAGLQAVAQYEREFGTFDDDELTMTDQRLDELGVGRAVPQAQLARADEALRRLRGESPGGVAGAV